MPATSPVVSANSWTNFWRYPMPHYARAVLLRTFHSKLPCKPRLYPLGPTTFLDPFCPLCVGVNTDECFLWPCPLKRPLWLKSASRFFLQPTSLDYKHITLPMTSELKVLPQFFFWWTDFCCLCCMVVMANLLEIYIWWYRFLAWWSYSQGNMHPGRSRLSSHNNIQIIYLFCNSSYFNLNGERILSTPK